MEWQLDLFYLLEELGRINHVNEFSLLVLRVLHLESQNSEHEELFFWVSSQVNGSLFLNGGYW